MAEHSAHASADIKEEAVLTASSEHSRWTCHHDFPAPQYHHVCETGARACVCAYALVVSVGGDWALAYGSFSTDNEKDHQARSNRHKTWEWEIVNVPLGKANERCLWAVWGAQGHLLICCALQTQCLLYWKCGLLSMAMRDRDTHPHEHHKVKNRGSL